MHVYNCIKFWILSQRKKQVTSYVIRNNCLNFNKLCCDKFCNEYLNFINYTIIIIWKNFILHVHAEYRDLIICIKH